MENILSNKEAFVYCWTDFLTNKLYVGVHKGTTDDGYICSSKIVKEEYTKRPNDFSRQIIASGPFKEMYVLETAILKAAKADKDPGFYNATLNHGPFYCKGPHSLEHIEKRIAPLRGRARSPEAIEKSAAAHRGMKMPLEGVAKSSATRKAKNRKASEETKRKQSIALKGKPLSEDTKEKFSIAAKKRCQKESERKRLRDMCVTRGMLGKTHSPETRKKLREAALVQWQKRKSGDLC